MDFVIGRLQWSVRGASEDSLNRGMHFPVGWDPYFNDYMTLRDVYHYATQPRSGAASRSSTAG